VWRNAVDILDELFISFILISISMAALYGIAVEADWMMKSHFTRRLINVIGKRGAKLVFIIAIVWLLFVSVMVVLGSGS
jgi:hypothetical protein